MGEELGHGVQYMSFQRDSGWAVTVKIQNMRVAELFLHFEVADCTRSHCHCAAGSGLCCRPEINVQLPRTTLVWQDTNSSGVHGNGVHAHKNLRGIQQVP